MPHLPKMKRRSLNSDGTMSLTEHLQELRRRVLISLVALALGTVLGFIWYSWSPAAAIPSLGDILRGPYCELPPEARADFSADGSCKLLATGPFEMFVLRIKVGALAGAVFASPVWLYQIWAFITPGLHRNERRWTFTFVTSAVVLFVSGAVLAYFLIDQGLELLLTIGKETQVTALNGERYFNFILGLLVVFGVSFEVPLIIIMLNLAGIVHYEMIQGKRSIVILAVFLFAAVMTPSQDPLSMTALAVPVLLLVELAFQFCRFNDKRRNRKRPEWLDVADDASSGPIPAPTPVSTTDEVFQPDPIAPPAPVSRPATPPQPTVGNGTPKLSHDHFEDVL